MCRTFSWLFVLVLFSAASLSAQKPQSGDPPTPSNGQAPGNPSSSEKTKRDVGVLQGIAEATAKSTEEKEWFDGTGKALLLWNYLSAKTLSE